MREKTIFLFLSVLILIIIITPFISANFFDWITGKATKVHNVSITISAIQVDWVSQPIAQAVTEKGTTAVEVWFQGNISGGSIADIDNSTANANFTYTSESRANTTCVVIGPTSASSVNYSCIIEFWYWDSAANWTITAAVADTSANYDMNTSVNVTLNETTGFEISPNELLFDTLVPGSTNETSNNDPILMNNTANKDIAAGDIDLRSIDLYDEEDQSYLINSTNFTAHTSTGGDACSGTDCIECMTNILSNDTYVEISGANMSAGNNSLNYENETSGQEQLYLCLFEVWSGLAARTYSTDHHGSWTVQIT